MLNKQQMKIHIINPVLKEMNAYSREASDLVWGTMCVESELYFIRQKGCTKGNGAYGMIQMELATARDIIKNYIKYRPYLINLYKKYYNKSLSLEQNLMGNIQFQVFMCRTHYLRVPATIPEDRTGQARYWKSFYNTGIGAGTVEDYLDKWK